MITTQNELLPEEQQTWDQIVSDIAEAFRLNKRERKNISEHGLIRMFGLLPTFAECPNPKGTGFLNVATYMAERGGGQKYFLHSPEDDTDVLSRLEPFRKNMAGGKEDIIEKGLSLASLVMLKDYEADADEDRARNKYNPIASGAWDYKKMTQKLTNAVESIICPRLDSVLSIPAIYMIWWERG